MSSGTENHPLLQWLNGLIIRGGANFQNGDIRITPLGARRFALSVHNNSPVICWSEEDHKALGTVRWKSALLFGIGGHDWVALNCPDIRIKNSSAMNPVRLRLFIPITTGRLDPWKSIRPQKIGIQVFSMKNGQPVLTGSPLMSIPTTLKE